MKPRRDIDGLVADGKIEEGRAALDAFRERLAGVTVLDPACGSGNFLYIALRSLLDLEKQVIDYAAEQGLVRHDAYGESKPDVRASNLTITPPSLPKLRCGLGISSGTR